MSFTFFGLAGAKRLTASACVSMMSVLNAGVYVDFKYTCCAVLKMLLENQYSAKPDGTFRAKYPAQLQHVHQHPNCCLEMPTGYYSLCPCACTSLSGLSAALKLKAYESDCSKLLQEFRH